MPVAAVKDALPMILADGETVFLQIDRCYDLPKLEECSVLTEALSVTTKTRARLKTILDPFVAQWADVLKGKLEAIKPGLSDDVIALTQQERVAYSPLNLSAPLDQIDVCALAAAFLYWRTNESGEMFPTTKIGVVLGNTYAKAGSLVHPARGKTPCPQCGEPCDVVMTVRLQKGHGPDGSLSCPACGHREPLLIKTSIDWQEANVVQCGCAGCKAEIQSLADQLERLRGTRANRIGALAFAQIATIIPKIQHYNRLQTKEAEFDYLQSVLAFSKLQTLVRKQANSDAVLVPSKWTQHASTNEWSDIESFLKEDRPAGQLRLNILTEQHDERAFGAAILNNVGLGFLIDEPVTEHALRQALCAKQLWWLFCVSDFKLPVKLQLLSKLRVTTPSSEPAAIRFSGRILALVDWFHAAEKLDAADQILQSRAPTGAANQKTRMSPVLAEKSEIFQRYAVSVGLAPTEEWFRALCYISPEAVTRDVRALPENYMLTETGQILTVETQEHDRLQ